MEHQVPDTRLLRCAKCGGEKLSSEFPTKGKARAKKTGLQQFYPYCKPCHYKTQRAVRLAKWFSMSEKDYDSIFAHQGGVCAICKRPPKPPKGQSEPRKLSIDHDHKTGLIRGLLCNFCNRAIGLFRDDLSKFEATVIYLKGPPATAALGAEKFGLKGRVTNSAATVKRLNKTRLLPGPQSP